MARARLDKAPTFDQIAAAIRERMGMESLSGQAVGAWFGRGQEPDSFAVLPALAEAIGADPAALAWGDEWRSERVRETAHIVGPVKPPPPIIGKQVARGESDKEKRRTR